VVQHAAHNQASRNVVRQAPAQHAARAAAPRPPRQTAFNPLEGNLNSQQLGALAQNITKANTQLLVAAQQQQGREITGAEGTALQRQAGVSQTENQQLASLQAGEEGSAKTAQNNAAEAAMKAANAIQTGGQATGQQTAGFIDPAVQAALAQSASTAGALGGAAGQYAAAMGVSGANQMSQLRAAAAQRQGEGGTRLQGVYGQAQQKVQDTENAALAKQPADAKSLAVELGQKQFADVATGKSLGIKQQVAQTTAANDQTKNALTARGQNFAVQRNRENAQQRETASQRSARINEGQQRFNEWATKENVALSKLSAQDKASYDKAQVKIAEGKMGSPANAHKFVNTVESALGYAKAFIARERAEAKGDMNAVYQKVREQLQAGSGTGKEGEGGRGFNPAIVDAAMNLAVYGRMSVANEATAHSEGPVKQIRPQWMPRSNK
jgi:hypothetical protein